MEFTSLLKKLICFMWVVEVLVFNGSFIFVWPISLGCLLTWTLGKMLNTPHQALFDTFCRLDNVALWRTMWFCCMVWLFYYGSYLNRKDIIPPSSPKYMPVDNTMFYVWEVQISNLLGGNKMKIISNRTWHVILLNTTWQTMLCGSM